MNNITFIGCDKEYKDSSIVIQGAPFDGTVSFRSGTRFAPNQIRLDSEGIEKYSPYSNKDLADKDITDCGDVDITIGNKEKTLESIYTHTKKHLANNKKVLTMGGEHLISFAPIKAYYEQYNDLRIVHFDAHTDLREEFMGEELSHASVIKQASNIIGPNRIYQFGIRSGLKEEFEFARNNHYIECFTVDTVQEKVKELKD